MAATDDPQVAERQRGGPDDGSGRGRGRGRRTAGALAALSVLFAGTGLARDYFDVTWPGSTSNDPTRSAPTDGGDWTTGTTATRGTAATNSPADAAEEDLRGMTVLGGRTNLAELPRELAGQPGYENSIIIRCPENTSQDKFRAVVYELGRRYFRLTAQVRHHSAAPSRPAKAYLEVFVSIKQPDGTINRPRRGDPVAASGTGAPLSVDVEDADDVTLRVQCERPSDLVVLTDARLAAD
ncbi:hypothetical protein QQG74_11810 [Micromonospora sp. FIMYZ51]|uniref:hypothetical protein n=1 Tax=Micromonospora sp. FIMYZ51 TaxID=3051832 RepID=UPI00311E9AC7